MITSVLVNKNSKINAFFLFNTFGRLKSYFSSALGNRGLKILLVTNSIILLAGATLGPIQAVFVGKIGGDLMDIGLASGIFSFVAGVTVLISGKFTDKLKEPELIVVVGYLIVAAGFLSYLFVNSVLLLFVSQIIIGFGEAIYNPAFDALYSKHLNTRKAGSQWGLWEAANYFTAALGAVIGGVVAKNFGFTPIFIFMGMLCIISAIYIYFLPRKVL